MIKILHQVEFLLKDILEAKWQIRFTQSTKLFVIASLH